MAGCWAPMSRAPPFQVAQSASTALAPAQTENSGPFYASVALTDHNGQHQREMESANTEKGKDQVMTHELMQQHMWLECCAPLQSR